MITLWLLTATGCHGFQLGTSMISPWSSAFLVKCVPALRRRAQPLMDDAAWKPTRKPYIPSWTRGGSNIYREQQNEYNEYAKQQEAAPGTSDSGGDEATRDPDPCVGSPNDPTCKQGAFAAALAPEIEQACAPVHYLCISDVTDGHAVEGAKDGRAMRADGRDMKVLIVSESFSRKSGPARQQVVNGVLADYIRSGALHSVSMRTWTPKEWLAKGSPVDLGARCSYASNRRDVEVGPSLRVQGCTTALPDELPPVV